MAHFLGPYLPDLSGALVSFWILFGFVKVWKPKNIRGYGGVPVQAPLPRAAGTMTPEMQLPNAFRAWMPYVVLIAVVVAWTGPWSHLPAISLYKAQVSAVSSITHKPISSLFNFNPFSGGTSILVSWVIIAPDPAPERRGASGKTFAQHREANVGRMAGWFLHLRVGLCLCLYRDGQLAGLRPFPGWGRGFIVLAPIIGWIGVALSGSNTSTNAMFGPVQAVTGRLLGFPLLILPSLNSVGAEVGKPSRTADLQRGCGNLQVCAQRRSGHSPQYGVDADHARLPDRHWPAVLLCFSRSDAALKLNWKFSAGAAQPLGAGSERSLGARSMACRRASSMLRSSALPVPAMSKAVP